MCLLVGGQDQVGLSEGCLFQLLHVHGPPGGSILLSHHHHYMLPHCWLIYWYRLDNPQLHVSRQLLPDLLLAVHGDWGGDMGSVWYSIGSDGKLEWGARHAGEVLVGTHVHSRGCIV